MPPAPRRPRTSYRPSRVPASRAMATLVRAECPATIDRNARSEVEPYPQLDHAVAPLGRDRAEVLPRFIGDAVALGWVADPVRHPPRSVRHPVHLHVALGL